MRFWMRWRFELGCPGFEGPELDGLGKEVPLLEGPELDGLGGLDVPELEGSGLESPKLEGPELELGLNVHAVL